ncbi:MAG: cytidine deaminase [Lachnospiraceae bacterium]|jgi:cytidine deaminase|nr:cytidine deaminase [Lachnospiraceae bacterium]MDD6579339.1 cytidine deaminase [Lachnospiraceae bacterium]
MKVSYEQLIENAIEARKMAYTPYSKYKVGAALLSSDNKIIKGCNIENAAYGPTNCAERTAFFKAVSEGVKEFSAIAIVGGLENETDLFSGYAFPCGVCRQVMREFCDSEFEIVVARSTDDYKVYTLGELLPESFGPDNLKA